MATKATQPNPDPPEKKAAAKVKVIAGNPVALPAAKKPRRRAAATTAAAESELVRKFNEWEEASKAKSEPNYDNQPLGILKAFPKADEVTFTEPHLAQCLWWWRKANPKDVSSIFRHKGLAEWTQILFSLYQDHFEHSAYLYELRARFEQRYDWDFGYPWVYCSRQQRRMLDCLWKNPYPAQNWVPGDEAKAEWAQLKGVSLNLRLNNTVLIEQFVGELERLRRWHEIPAPTAGGGVRRKPIAWRPIELLDIRRYKLRDLDDSERSWVSKAVRDYKNSCQQSGLQP